KLSNDEVSVKVIHSSTGAVNENDVMLASASNAIIVGFHVHPNSKASLLAHREHVEIRKHSIIYDAINSIKSAMEGMLAPDLQEELMGQAEIRELFKVPKIGVIAGCYVTSGKIQKSNRVRLIRDGIEIFEGELSSLRRFKDDANEVKESFECGISIKNYQDLKVGDVIEGFVIREIAKTLD
ncbi:MAG TPA: translation initiation factor IF-2, partial [Spirochaetes bacterium]|nr:translation initiation factor IF-2 [Spirochaetota bacterium]